MRRSAGPDVRLEALQLQVVVSRAAETRGQDSQSRVDWQMRKRPVQIDQRNHYDDVKVRSG